MSCSELVGLVELMASAGKICYHTMMTGISEAGELSLEPLVTCKLCLCEYSLDKMTTLHACNCIFCTSCLKQYMQLAIREGCGSPITCPDMVCLNHGTLQDVEISSLIPVDQFQLYQRLKLEREVHLDPLRTWCPSADCQTVCQIEPSESGQPVPVKCQVCYLTFCSSCKEPWHLERACRESQLIVAPSEQGSLIRTDTEAPVKQCPVCRIYIERNEGCAQMMCKNCKHTFCWYCLQNLDVSDVWKWLKSQHSSFLKCFSFKLLQIVGILVGLGIIALVTSPLLLLASPCIICCVCKSCRGKKKKHEPPTT
ncbi:hypothetical protein lerEdw1_007186 [Lerista edwardsae]|nr:hypothetical protein lerEdw1_007186 [Lerista edwardsae]